MPPEQCVNARSADARSDICALGATWHHMVVGEPPFPGASAVEVMQKHQRDPLKWSPDVRSNLPKGVIRTIERMMAKAPQNRIQKAEDLITTIKSQCLGERDVFKELRVKRETTESPISRIKSFASLFPDAAPAGAPAARPSAKSKASEALEGTVPAARKTVAAGAKGAYQDLVAHYDDHDRKFRRKKAIKKALSAVVQLLILAVLIGAVIVAIKYGLPRITSSKSAPGPAPAEKSP